MLPAAPAIYFGAKPRIGFCAFTGLATAAGRNQ
jgi:hypothetical protein